LIVNLLSTFLETNVGFCVGVSNKDGETRKKMEEMLNSLNKKFMEEKRQLDAEYKVCGNFMKCADYNYNSWWCREKSGRYVKKQTV
jgi:hypothetical protein